MDGVKVHEESIYLPSDIVRKSPGFTVDVGKSSRIHSILLPHTHTVDVGRFIYLHTGARVSYFTIIFSGNAFRFSSGLFRKQPYQGGLQIQQGFQGRTTDQQGGMVIFTGYLH